LLFSQKITIRIFVLCTKNMQIQYYGLTCVKITMRPEGRSTEEMVIFFDPFEGDSKIRSVYGNADVVFLTSKKEYISLKGIKGNPIIFDMPGEYSYRSTHIIGFEGANEQKKSFGQNTVFLIESEDMQLAHLGMSGDLSQETLSQLNGVDIVMIPIGGNGAYDAKGASDILRIIEPKIVIPIYYAIASWEKEQLDSKELFYKEMGIKDKEILSKFVVKAKDCGVRSGMDIVELETGR
jgi:hypothetical protein